MATDTITIYDIAAQAKVSIATVSRAFNDSPRVSPKTRDRIFAVAKDLGYHPNSLARNLARQQSSLVSAVIPMMTSYFYLEVLQGVQSHIAASEYDLLVYSAPQLEDVEGLLESALTRGKSAGVLLFSTPMEASRVALLKSREQPVILVDQHHPDFDSVSIDNEEGGALATEHLLNQGYRRIAMIMANTDSVPAMKRAEGFRMAHRAANIEIDESLVVGSHDPAFHGYTEEAGYKAMVHLLKHPSRPEAVFATSDIQALGAKRAIEDAGLEVGKDIGLIGFDDIMISRYVGLSTLRQPMFDIGARAADLLLQRIEKPDAPVSHTVYSSALVARTSSNKCQGS